MSDQPTTSNQPDLETILKRLEKAEKAERTLKRFGVGILVLIAAIAAMGQGQRVRTVEAERFVLKDEAGRTRAEIGMDPSRTPSLKFFGENGERVSEFRAGSLMLVAKDEDTRMSADGLSISQTNKGHIELGTEGLRLKITSASEGFGYASLGIGSSLADKGVVGPALVLAGNKGQGLVELDTADGTRLHLDPGLWEGKLLPGGSVDITAEGPLIQIADQQGLTAAIGRFELRNKETGHVLRTPTASFVLAGKDRVLWTAP